ncbi:hypothetical protein [Phytoactinopolyspora halotolerans]|uniref:Uncharacterized protein n=1 Tax=Phytoactinopolyspora halotolerans TaxID=1981512 RepID=A0A6L9S7I9_9ACTN|nr:hypothetical protein [Phytoactinopolyspora halotolerans]NEE01445.1 hypothetical protein [Phytoactinopolyspora halotolerans]
MSSTTSAKAGPLRTRTPGYRAARRLAGRALRRSDLAMRIARRLSGSAAPRTSGQHRSMAFRPGRYFVQDGARRLPVVVVVATGLTDGEAERIAREFEYAQMMTGSFRPLFVIDSADFAPFRSRGYVVERVMRAHELAVASPGDSYGEYLFSRLRSIASDYGAASIVPLPEGSAATLRGSTARLVGALAPA